MTEASPAYAERPPISENLRGLKDRADVTWKDVAQGIETTQRHVEEWGRVGGRYQPSWPKVVLLAAYFSRVLGEDIEPGQFYLDPGGTA